MQDGVTLLTKEDELDIKYGPLAFHDVDFKERVSDLALASVKYILNDLNDIRKRYMLLGFHLSEFKRCCHYVEFGYTTFDGFCEANFGLDKSAVSRCINVYHEFNASKSITYENGVKEVGSAMELDPRYKEYSYSQLCEMVSMSDEQRKQINPNMTIKQIREKKKNFSRVAMSQQDNREEFDSNNYSIKKGIVQQNYVKNCKSLYNINFRIFDKNGKEFKNSKFFDVLKVYPGTIYLRLVEDIEDISDLFFQNVFRIAT